MGEVPDQFLLLRINGDDRLPSTLKRLDLLIDVRKLRIAIGWVAPSFVLRRPCKLYPNPSNSWATLVWLSRCPWRVNSAANLRVLLHVQRKGDRGSPRAVGSTKASNAPTTLGSSSTRRLRPPPGRRTRRLALATEGAGRRSSRWPRRIVLSLSPVARATVTIPPRPKARASLAAQSLRPRSSSSGRRSSYFSWRLCIARYATSSTASNASHPVTC